MKKGRTVRRVIFGSYTVIIVLSVFLLAAVLLFLGACVRTEPDLWVMAGGQGRIPALVTAPDGTLVAVCEVNGGLQVGRSSDGGKTWTASSAEALRGLRYPCLVADGRDLLLFASTVSTPPTQPPEQALSSMNSTSRMWSSSSSSSTRMTFSMPSAAR